MSTAALSRPASSTPSRDDTPLPASSKALAKIAEASEWDLDRRAMQSRSEQRAWLVAGGAIVLAILGLGVGLYGSMKPVPAPGVIVVGELTGQTAWVGQITKGSVPQVLTMDQKNAADFVRAYEGYTFGLLQRDYNQVARMSTPAIWEPYASKYRVPNAMQDKVGRTQEHVITVINVRMSTTTDPGRTGEAIVTFDKEIKSTQGNPSIKGRYVATVRYEYEPGAMKSDADRIENPFGFLVLNYRVDAELVAPTPSSSTSTSPQSGSPS